MSSGTEAPAVVAQSAPTGRQFDVVFFLKRFPSKVAIYDHHLFAHRVAPNVPAAIIKSVTGLQFSDFFEEHCPGLASVGQRIEAGSVDEALDRTRYSADAMIDAFSIALDRGDVPRIANLALVIDSADGVGKWMAFSPTSWIKFSPEKPDATEGLPGHSQSLLNSVTPFFNVIAGIHPNHDCQLARQVTQSMKMHRHGATADSFAIEFICKFSALEGLVCALQSGKRRLLTERLPLLFRDDGRITPERVANLWESRNAAVHESAGFYSSHSAGSKSVQTHLNDLDMLFRGTMVFAIAHLESCPTVADLWKKAAAYELPPWSRRRSNILTAHRLAADLHTPVPWAKKWFDENLAFAQRQREE